jgi:hypothetical protein
MALKLTPAETEAFYKKLNREPPAEVLEAIDYVRGEQPVRATPVKAQFVRPKRSQTIAEIAAVPRHTPELRGKLPRPPMSVSPIMAVVALGFCALLGLGIGRLFLHLLYITFF